jgi:hypothetical protein
VISHLPFLEWMQDFEIFQQSLEEEQERGTYMTSLIRSMNLVLEEFYQKLRVRLLS